MLIDIVWCRWKVHLRALSVYTNFMELKCDEGPCDDDECTRDEGIREKLFMDMRSCKKMTLFFSIARLLLWPLQDVLINNLRNVMEIFSSSSLSFFYYNIFFLYEAAKCRWGEEWASIQFYEFMTGTLNKIRWS